MLCQGPPGFVGLLLHGLLKLKVHLLLRALRHVLLPREAPVKGRWPRIRREPSFPSPVQRGKR